MEENAFLFLKENR